MYLVLPPDDAHPVKLKVGCIGGGGGMRYCAFPGCSGNQVILGEHFCLVAELFFFSFHMVRNVVSGEGKNRFKNETKM